VNLASNLYALPIGGHQANTFTHLTVATL
jgi:hypothetical protein